MSRKLQDLTIKDAFMFAAVMSDCEQCRHFLSLALEKKILEVSVITEKSSSYHPEHHGIRLDVWAEEHGTRRRFNVEMQVKSHKNLPKRSRYYHAHMDVDALTAGADYDTLPDTYVIFICDFAPFDTGDSHQFQKLYRYHFRNICVENSMALADGSETIFLSTKGENDSDVPRELVNFLKYVGAPENGKNIAADDVFIASLYAQVEAIKRNRDWEAKFMVLELMLKEEREAAREEGLKEGLEEGLREGRAEGHEMGLKEGRAEGHEMGLKEGREEGMLRINALIYELIQANRLEDITRLTNDQEYRDLLFKEFNL